jgi:CubicO group peptidase (beta-lactamase class C family)
MIEVHGFCDDRFNAVKDAFTQNFEENLEMGASLGITLRGKMVVDLWGGYTDAEKIHPWEKDTIVNVYSTTKVIGALCVHILVDRGLINLDSPVSTYWPEFAQAGKAKMPVRFLLSHTSGIPRFDESISVTDLYNWEKMTTMIASEKPWWEPGTRSGYQSITFSFLIGELVRRVLEQSGNSSKTLGNFFRTEVAEPLDIDFHIGLDEKHDSRVAELVYSNQTVPKWFERVLKVFRPKLAKVLFNPHPFELLKHSRTREWRAAELTSSNGHGNGRSIAKIGAVLACGGTLSGQTILSKSAVKNAITEQIYNRDLLGIGSEKVRWGLGYALESPNEKEQGDLALGNQTFHWGGWGGSKCIMDYEKQVSVGYAMNKMGPTIGLDVRAVRIAKEIKKIAQNQLSS